MNLEALAIRNANAIDRIRKAALHLADVFRLSQQAQTLAGVRHRDPQIAALLEREAVADLLEGIVAETGGYPDLPAPDLPELTQWMREAGDDLPAPAAPEPEPLPPVEITPEPEPVDEASEPEPEPPLDSLIAGIGPEIAEVLRERGIHTPADLAAASDEALLGVPGLSKARLRRIRQQVAALQHPEQ